MDWEDVLIEKMTPEDLEEVLSIETSSFSSPWSENMFIQEMKNPFAYCFVARTEAVTPHPIVGFLCFRNILDESELLKIAISTPYRELGIARKMMQYYIDFGRRSGIKMFFLEVNASNQPAIRLYQRFDYQPFGTRKNFYQGKFDALLMIKKVETLYGSSNGWNRYSK